MIDRNNPKFDASTELIAKEVLRRFGRREKLRFLIWEWTKSLALYFVFILFILGLFAIFNLALERDSWVIHLPWWFIVLTVVGLSTLPGFSRKASNPELEMLWRMRQTDMELLEEMDEQVIIALKEGE